MIAPLRIHGLGELRVLRGAEPVPLPPSRKTRALLGYLALTARPHRRERLCEIFWDLPDDPRGALRWSLNKLRPLLYDGTGTRVVADRERASLALDTVPVDLRDVRIGLDPAGPPPSQPMLRSMAEALARPLLDGLDLPQCEPYHAWLTEEREEARLLRLAALERIALHPGTVDAELAHWARARATDDPLSATAAGTLVRTLRQLGRAAEADDAERIFRYAAQEAGCLDGSR